MWWDRPTALRKNYILRYPNLLPTESQSLSWIRNWGMSRYQCLSPIFQHLCLIFLPQKSPYHPFTIFFWPHSHGGHKKKLWTVTTRAEVTFVSIRETLQKHGGLYTQANPSVLVKTVSLLTRCFWEEKAWTPAAIISAIFDISCHESFGWLCKWRAENSLIHCSFIQLSKNKYPWVMRICETHKDTQPKQNN